jgi:hypothetical protein
LRGFEWLLCFGKSRSYFGCRVLKAFGDFFHRFKRLGLLSDEFCGISGVEAFSLCRGFGFSGDRGFSSSDTFERFGRAGFFANFDRQLTAFGVGDSGFCFGDRAIDRLARRFGCFLPGSGRFRSGVGSFLGGGGGCFAGVLQCGFHARWQCLFRSQAFE